MCNLYSITTNQAAIAALFRVMNRYVGNLPLMPGVLSMPQQGAASAISRPADRNLPPGCGRCPISPRCRGQPLHDVAERTCEVSTRHIASILDGPTTAATEG